MEYKEINLTLFLVQEVLKSQERSQEEFQRAVRQDKKQNYNICTDIKDGN